MPELVVLGNLLVDDIVYADGTTRMGQAGGAVLYFALAARLFGVEVGVVSWRGDEYPRATLDALEERGVDLSGVLRLGRPGLRTWLLHEGRQRQVVHHLAGPRHAEVSPKLEHIPSAWLARARAFHLAPMPIDLQRGLVEALRDQRADALISLDPYELLRDGDGCALQELLRSVDLFFLSEDEVLFAREPREAFAELFGGRLCRLLFKRGSRGGIAFEKGPEGALRSFGWEGRASRIVDPTGPGDAFAAGFLSGQLRDEPLEPCCRLGVVAASFALEAPGADGLMMASPEKADERLRELFGDGAGPRRSLESKA